MTPVYLMLAGIFGTGALALGLAKPDWQVVFFSISALWFYWGLVLAIVDKTFPNA